MKQRTLNQNCTDDLFKFYQYKINELMYKNKITNKNVKKYIIQ